MPKAPRLNNGITAVYGQGPSVFQFRGVPVDAPSFVVKGPVAYCPCQLTSGITAMVLASSEMPDPIEIMGEPVTIDVSRGENICFKCGRLYIREDYQDRLDLLCFQAAMNTQLPSENEASDGC